MLWLILFLFVTLGAAALWRGLRGRRTDDHPLCRRCGFDLHGKPPASTRCPECGSDLRIPSAIRTGHRERIRWLTGIGYAGLALGLIGLVAATWASARGFDFQQHKPLSWLIRDTESKNISRRIAAFREIDRRITTFALSDEEMVALSERALVLQGDESVPWDNHWGDVAMNLVMPLERQERFTRQALQPVLRVRQNVRLGYPLPAEMWMRPARIAPYQFFHVKFRFLEVRIDGKSIGYAPDPLDVFHVDDDKDNTSYVFYLHPKDLVPPPGLGKHIIEADVQMNVGEASRLDVRPNFPPTTLRAEFEIKPDDFPTHEPDNRQEMRQFVEGGLSMQGLAYSPSTPARVEGYIQIGVLPVDIIYSAFLIVDGKEHPFSGFHVPAGRSGAAMLGGEIPNLSGRSVDILLRATPQESQSTVTILRPWTGDVTIKDVPVR